MDIKQIIKNLEHYNNWRRDNDDKYTMPEPKQIGITIDAAISELNKLLICDVVKCNCDENKQLEDEFEITHLINNTYQVVGKKTNTVWKQGTLEECNDWVML